jgi:hypothetical protein
MTIFQARRQAQPMHHDVADAGDLYITRLPTSTRRYNTHQTYDDSAIQIAPFIQHRASRKAQSPASQAVMPSGQGDNVHHIRTHRFSLLMVIFGAVTALLLILLVSTMLSWWQGFMDNIHYGYPRTSHLDAVVGHHDSETNKTHFIFLNLHGHIEIIEIPGGDTSQTHVYTGPTFLGAGQDLVPITGEIRTEGGQRNLIVHFQNQQVIFINDGTTFHLQ